MKIVYGLIVAIIASLAIACLYVAIQRGLVQLPAGISVSNFSLNSLSHLSWTLVGIWAIGLTALYLLLRFELAALAKENKFVTFPVSGKIKIVVEGEKTGGRVVKYITDTQGFKVSSEGIVEEEEDPNFYPLQKLFGVRWVGITPRTILEYSIKYSRPRKPGDEELVKGPDAEFDPAYPDVVLRDTKTDYAMIEGNYTYVFHDLVLADNSTINIKASFTARVVDVYKSVIVRNGYWFDLVISELSGAFNDYLKQYDNQTWKGTDPKTKISRTKELHDVVEGIKDSIFKASGMQIDNFAFEDSSPADKELAKINNDVAKAEGLANAVRKRAQGQADAIRAVGDARAHAERELVNAAASAPGGQSVVMTDRMARAIGKHNGPLSIGANGGGFIVNDTTQSRPTPSTGNKPNQGQKGQPPAGT